MGKGQFDTKTSCKSNMITFLASIMAIFRGTRMLQETLRVEGDPEIEVEHKLRVKR